MKLKFNVFDLSDLWFKTMWFLFVGFYKVEHFRDFKDIVEEFTQNFLGKYLEKGLKLQNFIAFFFCSNHGNLITKPLLRKNCFGDK